jgi:hypothetical protein
VHDCTIAALVSIFGLADVFQHCSPEKVQAILMVLQTRVEHKTGSKTSCGAAIGCFGNILKNPFTKAKGYDIVLQVTSKASDGKFKCFIQGMEDMNKSVATESMRFFVELNQAFPSSTERIEMMKVLNQLNLRQQISNFIGKYNPLAEEK